VSRDLEIRLVGIRAFGYHGVLPEERRDGQDFVVDLTALPADDRACDTDDLGDAVDYGALADRVVAHVAGPPVDLLERLGDAIACDLLENFPLRAVEVTVHKPHAPVAAKVDDVIVVVRRSR
jgi:dihydroneopterin aldolase